MQKIEILSGLAKASCGTLRVSGGVATLQIDAGSPDRLTIEREAKKAGRVTRHELGKFWVFHFSF
jgi:hypothetical protein